jgi:hypothetical protein
MTTYPLATLDEIRAAAKLWVPHPFVGFLTKGWDTADLNRPL